MNHNHTYKYISDDIHRTGFLNDPLLIHVTSLSSETDR